MDFASKLDVWISTIGIAVTLVGSISGVWVLLSLNRRSLPPVTGDSPYARLTKAAMPLTARLRMILILLIFAPATYFGLNLCGRWMADRAIPPMLTQMDRTYWIKSAITPSSAQLGYWVKSPLMSLDPLNVATSTMAGWVDGRPFQVIGRYYESSDFTHVIDKKLPLIVWGEKELARDRDISVREFVTDQKHTLMLNGQENIKKSSATFQASWSDSITLPILFLLIGLIGIVSGVSHYLQIKRFMRFWESLPEVSLKWKELPEVTLGRAKLWRKLVLLRPYLHEAKTAHITINIDYRGATPIDVVLIPVSTLPRYLQVILGISNLAAIAKSEKEALDRENRIILPILASRE